MMPHPETPHLVSAATVEAILAAAGRLEPATPETIDWLQEWLSGALERAIWRANEKPLTKDEIVQIKAACERLEELAAPLRHRADPPPRTNMRAWGSWFAAQDADRKRGPPGKIDWMLIADLLAVYEVTSGRKASARKPDYEPYEVPTMTFLEVTLRLIRAETPVNIKIRLHTPSREAVRINLPKIKHSIVAWSKISLSPWLDGLVV